MTDDSNPEMAEMRRRLQRVEDTVAAMTAKNDQWRAEAAAAVSSASDARRLAAGASSDVTDAEAKLRAHERVLQALRDTQVEQGQQLTQLVTQVTGLEAQGRLNTAILGAIATHLGIDTPSTD